MRTLDAQRGQQILQSAAELFGSHHYHEVRMEDIAANARVAKGTLYRYFQDKEDLYIALTMDGMQQLFDQLQDELSAPAKPEDKLLAYITGVVRFYEKQPYFLELWMRIETSRAAASVTALKTIRSQFFRLVNNLIVEINATGRYPACDTELASLALMGIIRGLLRFRPQPWPNHLPTWIWNQFMHGLGGCGMTPQPGPGR